MSASVRNFVWELIGDDPILNSLGYNRDSLFVNWSGDSPAAALSCWAALRWGTAEQPPHQESNTRVVNLAIWAYDREPDFTRIDRFLGRVRELLLTVAGARCEEGAVVVAVSYTGSGEDQRDPVMDAVLRWENFRVVANGF